MKNHRKTMRTKAQSSSCMCRIRRQPVSLKEGFKVGKENVLGQDRIGPTVAKVRNIFVEHVTRDSHNQDIVAQGTNLMGSRGKNYIVPSTQLN